MEIFTLLETLEEILEQSKKLPFTDKAVVDKEAILEVIKEIRLKLPDELKQAKWIKEERQRILTEAQKEANDIVKEAETRIISMIDEHEITKKAYEQKAQIIETANEMSREISQGTKEYADNVLGSIQTALEDALKDVKYDLDITQQDTVDGYVDAINKAIAQLKYKVADYTEVDKAIEKANKEVSSEWLYETIENKKTWYLAMLEMKLVANDMEISMMSEMIRNEDRRSETEERNRKKEHRRNKIRL